MYRCIYTWTNHKNQNNLLQKLHAIRIQPLQPITTLHVSIYMTANCSKAKLQVVSINTVV